MVVCFSAEAPLHGDGYFNLIGSNKHSWGWNLKTLKLAHDDNGVGNDDNENNIDRPDVLGDEKSEVSYPAAPYITGNFLVPEQIFSKLPFLEFLRTLVKSVINAAYLNLSLVIGY